MRSDILDKRLGPFENLATNPRFNRCVPGETVFRRNLATNPQFKRVVPGTEVVRRNLFTCPTFSEIPGYWGENSNQPIEVVTSWRDPARNAIRGTGLASNIKSSSSQVAVTPGVLYTVSAVGRRSSPGILNLRIDWRGPSGFISTSNEILPEVVDALQEKLIAESGVAPPGATSAQVWFQASLNSGTEAWFEWTEPLFEQRPAVLPYFDGDTPDDLGFVYEWEGAPGESTSVVKASPVEVRRNLVLNPRGIGASGSTPGFGWVNQWAGGPSGGTFFSELPGGGVRREWLSSADRNWEVGFGVRQDVTEGETISVSMVVRFDFGSTTPPGGSDNGYKLRAKFHDIDNNILANVYSSEFYSYSTLSDGVPRIFSISGIVVPPGATSVFVSPQYHGSSNPSPLPQTGFAMEISKPIVEYAPVLLPYFDGDSTPDADLMPVWTGTPNESESTLIGPQVNQIGTGGGGNVARVASWNADLDRWSLRVIRAAAGNGDTNATLDGDANNGLRTGMLAGRTYTVFGKLRLKEPVIPAGTSTDYLAIRAFWRVGLGSYSSVYVQAPNVVGTHSLSLTFTLPSDATEAFVRLTHKSEIGSDIYWDEIALIEHGPYNGPHFDGSTDPGDTGIVYEWEGTPHESSSVMKVGVVEVRRNLAKNSSLVLEPAGLSSDGGIIRTSAEFIRGVCPSSWRTEKTLSSTHIFGRIDNQSTTGDTGVVPAGVIRHMSAWIYAEQNTEVNLVRRGVAGYVASKKTLNAGWNFVKTAFLGDGTKTVGWDIGFEASTGDIGDVIHICAILVEDNREPIGADDEWFSGDYTPDGDLSPAWTGTPNASESVLYGAGIASNSLWATVDRGVFYRNLNENCARFLYKGPGPCEIGIGSALGVYAGTGATVFMRIRHSRSKTSDNQSVRYGTGGAHTAYEAIENQWIDTRYKGPIGSVFASQHVGLILKSDLVVGETVDIAQTLKMPGIYDGPYFDGDDERVVWRGTPHGSTSVGYPPLT